MRQEARPKITTDRPLKIHANYLSIYDATWSGYAGIVLWGGLYGMLWPAIVGVVAFFSLIYGGLRFSPSDLWAGLFWWVVTILLCGVAGAMLSGLIGLVTTLCITLFNETMGCIWTPITAISISGGMAGFVSAAALCFGVGEGFFVFGPVLYLVGPVFAMILGQVGALRMSSSRLANHFLQQRTKVNQLWRGDVRENLSKFNLKQMLAMTGWFAGTFAILSTVGQFSLFVALVFASYFLIQPPIYFLVNRVFRFYVRRQLDQVLLNESDLLALKTNDIGASVSTRQDMENSTNPFDI